MRVLALAAVAIATVFGAALVAAQAERTANVELRLWERVSDPGVNFISARPEGGSWRTFGTVWAPLDDGFSGDGRYRYGDFAIRVPQPELPGSCEYPQAKDQTVTVELRVWEDTRDETVNYVSARPEGGSWRTLGTVRLPLDDGLSDSGRYRYGDFTVRVPVPDGEEQLAERLAALQAEQAEQREALLAEQAAAIAALEAQGRPAAEIDALRAEHASALQAFNVAAAFDYIVASIRVCS